MKGNDNDGDLTNSRVISLPLVVPLLNSRLRCYFPPARRVNAGPAFDPAGLAEEHKEKTTNACEESTT